jgi:integrase/recombinase XerD
MRYPLDFRATFDETLLFWMERYVRNKLTTLSNAKVTNRELLTAVLQRLQKGIGSIDALRECIVDARRAGMIGINVCQQPLIRLYEYLKPMGMRSMREIDQDIILDYLAGVTSGMADATKRNYKTTISTLFSYIDKNNEDDEHNSYRYGIELKNWSGISSKKGNKLPQYLKSDEMSQFIDAIESCPFKSGDEFRNRLCLKIIVYTGVRVAEALNMRFKDFKLVDGAYVVTIKQKGNKERIVLIKYDIVTADLNALKKIDNRDDEDLLFVSRQKSTYGKQLTQSTVHRVVEKVLGYAGIVKSKNGAHMLRHSFATMIYNKSKDILLTQEALGHDSVETTRIYTHFDEDNLRKAASIMDGV